jgi:toxin ParE1/3/4
MEFKLNPEAKIDIQNEINYYNDQQKGLGKKFHFEIKHYFKAIKKNPFYQIRYKNVRCLPLKKFPVMIHFTVDEDIKRITIRAVINTYRDQKEYWK